MAGVVDPVLTDSFTPLYFYGSKVLKAEILFLEIRVKDDLQLGWLPALPSHDALQKSKSSPAKPDFKTTVRVVQPATVLSQPITPKYNLIIVLGTIFGFMTAIIVVFVLNLKNKISKDD